MQAIPGSVFRESWEQVPERNGKYQRMIKKETFLFEEMEARPKTCLHAWPLYGNGWRRIDYKSKPILKAEDVLKKACRRIGKGLSAPV